MEVSLSKILSSIAEGVVAFDKHGAVTYANPHVSLLLDYTAKELLAMHIDEVFNIVRDEDKLPIGEKIYDTVIGRRVPLSSGSYASTLYISSRDRYFPVFIAATPIFDQDEVSGGIVSLRDITAEEKKRVELSKSLKQIDLLNAELIKKIEELNKPR